MKVKLLSLLLFAASAGLSAQSINDKELQEIRKGFDKENPQTIAIQNALTGNKNIRTLALNNELQGKIDHYFKYRVNVKGITDQKSSGRCWMFTSMNVLRPGIMEKYNLTQFDFSHNYLYFWDIFEKSNLFLENIIATASKDMDDRAVVEYFKSPVSDGGVWNLYYNVAEKYGVVPQEVMLETAHSDNTSQLVSLINERLRAGGYSLRELSAAKKKTTDIQAAKTVILKDVYRILVLCLGEPPVEFTWRYKDKNGDIKELKNYTPKQFYKEITPADYSPDNYIMIMNDPTREYYKVYEIANYRNTIEGINWTYLNLPNEAIKKAALQSIKGNEAMYASCDVGKQFNRESGILDPQMYDYNSLLGVELDMDKKARILTRQSGSSHAMTLIGCDTDENDIPLKWEFENSWGAASGNKGYLTFTDDWFDEYMFRLVIHRKYLDNKSLGSLKQKPVQLPIWDYMF
ncbi:aminopeptidase C [Dysgonomonas sp. 25]|uniref:aminopeptidase C n=1 Tax=Dysgonomonas sp. 25 TaxID=2302933 RepID=UPI0013D52C77|nr:C1 family peptidase [Dysgonomonas sp. 25]NDV67655.1 biotin transporter BioY [Dysgonomonas sp. 25]